MMMRLGVIAVEVFVLAVVTKEVDSQSVEILSNRKAFPRLNDSVSTNTKDIEDLKEMIDEKIKKLEESLICPNIAEESDLPKNTHTGIEKAVKGTQRELPCGDGYFQCGTNAVAVCQDNNKWKILHSSLSNCVEQTKIFKYTGEATTRAVLPCAMLSGTNISFKGTPTQDRAFAFSLMDDNENILLSNGYRFWQYGDYRKIVMNTKFGNWGSEQRSSVFPFKRYQKFTIIITRTSNGYKGYADGKLLYTFTQRSTTDPTQVKTGGDVKMESITVNYP